MKNAVNFSHGLVSKWLFHFMGNVSHCWVAEDTTGISAQKIPASKRCRSSHWCSRWRCSLDLLAHKEVFLRWTSAGPTLISPVFPPGIWESECGSKPHERSHHWRVWIISLWTAETCRLLSGNFMVGAMSCPHASQIWPNIWVTFYFKQNSAKSDLFLFIFPP